MSKVADLLSNPANVKRLSLDATDLLELGPRISEFVNAEAINLRYADTHTYPDEIWTLPRLVAVSVNIGPNGIPVGVKAVKRLARLEVGGNGVRSVHRLSELPEWLTTISSLETLTLDKSGLKSFPGELARLPALMELRIMDDADIGRVPDSLLDFSHLEILRLLRVRATSLPSALGRLRSLRILDLARTGITELPESIGGLGKLEELRVTECQLETVPASVGSLSNLRSLNLSNNPIHELPGSLVHLENLRVLDASSCRLTSIPIDICRLPNLALLNLARNTFSREAREDVEAAVAGKDSLDVRFPFVRRERPAPATKPESSKLSATVIKEMKRLGFRERRLDDAPTAVVIEGRDGEVKLPVALRQLAYGFEYPRRVLAPVIEDLEPVDVRWSYAELAEYDCIQAAPYCAFGSTEFYNKILIRLDDQNPSDPMLYYLDHEDYDAQELPELQRLSEWLRAASPGDEGDELEE